ncbi:MAG: PorV/PorQ family protein [Endomicrobiia bacterium]
MTANIKQFKLYIICFINLSLFLLLSSTSDAFLSKENIGTTSAQFLKLGIGAKSAGLGNAVSSVCNGSESIYWNPSNLAYLNQKEFSFSHTMWFEDINYEWLAFAMPTDKYGVFAVAVQYVSYGNLDKIDNVGVNNGSFSPIDMAVYLSYANRYKQFNFGGNLKYIYSKIENSASAVAIDLGTNYDFNNKTSIAAVISNFGTDMKFNNEAEPLPFLFKLGGSHFITNDWLVALDLNFPKDNELYINLGTEYMIVAGDNTDFSIRAGYDGRNKDIPGLNWINLGFGIRYLDYVVDYSFVPYGEIGMTHRLSFSIKFGEKTEVK